MSHNDIDLDEINKAIADRSDVFYWQTDRAIEPEQAGIVWADRHKYFYDNEIIEKISSEIGTDKLISIEPLDPNAQTSLGNVNSVRAGLLASGKEVVIRCHPKGIKNGYFHSEALASQKAKEAGLPSYDTLAVHDFESNDDFAFQVLEKLPGAAIQKWLETHPNSEAILLSQIGQMMARLHQVKVTGFGPFDNDKAKNGELVGLHETFGSAIRAGLPFNLDVLNKQGLLSNEQIESISMLFGPENPLLDVAQSVLVHNDFADWNLLTDGDDVTGILDWDECVGSDPVCDIACWSTFFEPERMPKFLEGYFSVTGKPVNFDERFELFRLRYTLSKMTLRLRRYSWDPQESVREKIEIGKTHLKQSMIHFGLAKEDGNS